MTTEAIDRGDPHAGMPVHRGGLAIEDALGAIVVIHGRGSLAKEILDLAAAIDPGGFAYLAPQAAENSWYPNRFIAPLESNEPWLTSALDAVARTVALATVAGIDHERIVLMGFSQGACLSLEYAGRNARRWGAVVGLSGGLIGPDDAPRDYPADLEQTPVFLGCSDIDAHIPVERVHESATVLRRLGGDVDERIYPGMGHTINRDEMEVVRGMLAGVVASS